MIVLDKLAPLGIHEFVLWLAHRFAAPFRLRSYVDSLIADRDLHPMESEADRKKLVSNVSYRVVYDLNRTLVAMPAAMVAAIVLSFPGMFPPRLFVRMGGWEGDLMLLLGCTPCLCFPRLPFQDVPCQWKSSSHSTNGLASRSLCEEDLWPFSISPFLKSPLGPSLFCARWFSVSPLTEKCILDRLHSHLSNERAVLCQCFVKDARKKGFLEVGPLAKQRYYFC